MSSDESPNAEAPRERRDAVREKAQQVQARQSRARTLRRLSLATAGVAAVALGAVAVTWVVSSSASRPQLSPRNAHDDGFSVTAVTGLSEMSAVDGSEVAAPAGVDPTPSEEAAPAATPSPTKQPSVDIRVYVDYLSSGSRDFQLANAQQLSEWVGDGAATLTYYPVAMLTAKSNGTKYSLRAASAAACVATHSHDTFFAFNDELLTKQPDVESDGYTDQQLADIAQATGAQTPKVVRACIEGEEFATWAKTATERALKGLPGTDGVALTGTPTVLVNGTQYIGALDDPKEFAQYVLTVASDTYYKSTPSPSPTPTPTATPAP